MSLAYEAGNSQLELGQRGLLSRSSILEVKSALSFTMLCEMLWCNQFIENAFTLSHAHTTKNCHMSSSNAVLHHWPYQCAPFSSPLLFLAKMGNFPFEFFCTLITPKTFHIGTRKNYFTCLDFQVIHSCLGRHTEKIRWNRNTHAWLRFAASEPMAGIGRRHADISAALDEDQRGMLKPWSS